MVLSSNINFKPPITTLYWICCQFGGVKKQWKTLCHNGVMFPPDYQPHHIPILYNGKPIYLNPLAEESAFLYAKYLDTDYIKNPTFNKNFWKDWKGLLGNNTEIKSFHDVDFTPIHDYLLKLKEEKKMTSNEDKEREKEKEAPYKIAYVNGKEEPVGNFKIEPPGIFIGRGNNPKIGRIKPRIYPEDVTLNLSADCKIPSPNMINHHWGNIIHDRTVDWLASWKDPLTNKIKYVWLGAQSQQKGESDKAKFDLARKLKRKIKSIREKNTQNMENPDIFIRQIATAVYLIDTFALRVGNEKGNDEADTVGVVSLRIEHITLLNDNIIKLDFLGKDAVRYLNVVPVIPIAYSNLENFIKGKELDDKIFDLITTNDVNEYLQTFMPGLTAKVFRTFNASYLFSRELEKIDKKYQNYTGDDKTKLLLEEFNKANFKVAKQMNHQKKISKSFNNMIDKLNEQIKKLTNQLHSKSINTNKRKKIKEKIYFLKTKKTVKIDTRYVALNTSKLNYIDPRISIAFIKKNDIPIDKIFTKTMQEKFKWAFNVDPNFKF